MRDYPANIQQELQGVSAKFIRCNRVHTLAELTINDIAVKCVFESRWKLMLFTIFD